MFIRTLLKFWRIILSVIVLQIIGSLIGLLINYHHDPWQNEWIGGVLSLPIGVVIGLIWQKYSPSLSSKISKEINVLIIVLSVGVAGYSMFLEFPRLKKDVDTIRYLRTISPGNISSITIYHQLKGDNLLSINLDSTRRTIVKNHDQKREFSYYCTDIEGVTTETVPGQLFYIVIDGKMKIELILRVGNEHLVAQIVKLSKNSISYYGHLKSRSLAFWVIENTKGG